ANLTENDYIIIMAGSNDFGKKKYPQFKLLCEKLKLIKHTNVIVASIPCKSDNRSRISAYNSKLVDFILKFNSGFGTNISHIDSLNENFVSTFSIKKHFANQIIMNILSKSKNTFL